MAIQYRSADTLRIGISLMGPGASVSQPEIFELPSSREWAGFSFNLSALASESWGNDLERIQLVFQPEMSGYTGTFSMNEIMIGDSVTGKTFIIGVDQPPPLFVELGNDTTIVAPASLQLDAGNPGNTYLWNTGETTRTIRVDTGGIYYVTVIGAHNCTLSDTIHVTLDIEDGISDPKTGPELNIYPNPARTMVYVEVPDLLVGSVLEIRDISGIPGKSPYKKLSKY